MNRPTLDDVAKLAGVSTATVSRCLNTPSAVKSDTRSLVMKAINTLGYTPNFGARALATRSTQMIGAIIPTMENAIFASGIQTFQETLAVNGYTLIVSSSLYRKSLEEEQIYNLVSHGTEAILLIGEDRDPKLYTFLKDRGIPYVLAWNYRESSQHIFVGFNNFAAAQNIASHVLAAGHKEIGILAGISKDNDRARDRLAGFRSVFEEKQIPIPSACIKNVPYDITAAGDALEDLLKHKISAVLCGNDVIAVGAMMRARQLDIQVPEEISITGFDDIEISRIVTPKLSTVRVPHRQMGRYAAKLLLRQLAGDEVVTSLELPTHFISRKTIQVIKNANTD